MFKFNSNQVWFFGFLAHILIIIMYFMFFLYFKNYLNTIFFYRVILIRFEIIEQNSDSNYLKMAKKLDPKTLSVGIIGFTGKKTNLWYLYHKYIFLFKICI
jgi:hypothetical protein